MRGDGKIIQELESYFRGAGWNVIKVVWGREWDALLAQDVDGALVNQMNKTPDGAVPDLLGRDRRLHPRALLRRGRAAAQDGRGPDRPRRSSCCRAAATTTARCTPPSTPASKHVGQPTVILAHTIKGWTIDALEGKNATHQMKKLNATTLKAFRDRLDLPVTDQEIDEHYEFDGSAPFYHPGEGSDELEYLRDRRRGWAAACRCGGSTRAGSRCPATRMYDELKQGSASRRSRPRWPWSGCSRT